MMNKNVNVTLLKETSVYRLTENLITPYSFSSPIEKFCSSKTKLHRSRSLFRLFYCF